MRVALVVVILSSLSCVMGIRGQPVDPEPSVRWSQEQTQPRRTRPRRVGPEPQLEPQHQPELPPQPLTLQTPASARPFIRVALALDVPSAVIASDQEVVRIDESNQEMVRLAEREIRVEPAPSEGEPLTVYRVQVAVVPGQEQIDKLIERLRAEFQQEVALTPDRDRQQQRICLGRFRSQEEAGRWVLRVKRAGYSEAKLVEEPVAPRPLLVARSTRDEVLLRVPSSLTFAPLNAGQSFLKYDGRAYRGRLIVQLNPRDRLTVINEVPLEEYLWSVVPNELGPTSFGELEALKAQAIAARTYAVWQKLVALHPEGYDVLADGRSQVYTGVDAEHPLSTRAVNETRGMIVIYQGQPIEAVYTSTCGGRTENAESVFNEPRPYLRSVLCAPEVSGLAAHAITSQRRGLVDRAVALLQLAGLSLPAEWGADELKSPATADEVYAWITTAAALVGRSPSVTALDKSQLTHLEGIAQALVKVFYPDEYIETLFTPADIAYILDDAADGAARLSAPRAAVAVLVREGILTPTVDRPLSSQAGWTRAEVLAALWRIVERRGLAPLTVGTVRWLSHGQLMIAPEKGEAQRYYLARAPFLFKLIGQRSVPVRRLVAVGGEKVWFHTDAGGRIDYLELQPHPQGVVRDRYSPASWWEVRMTVAEVTERLRGNGLDVGPLVDLRIVERGASGRITSLEVVGARGTKKLRGSAIRSALGLRDTLLVIDRKYDETGRVTEFTFTGRGWGHGVGLCQVGAYGLALEGFDFTDILKTYYTGVEITRIY